MKQLELTVLLRTIWALTLLYGEILAYWVPSLFACSWPHLLRWSPSNSTMLILSGHDSDQYTAAHQSNFGPVKEGSEKAGDVSSNSRVKSKIWNSSAEGEPTVLRTAKSWTLKKKPKDQCLLG